MLAVSPELDIELLPKPESVAQARHAAAELLTGLSYKSRDAVGLIVSELVTNAIKHGPQRAPVRLRIERDGNVVRGEVEDQGDGTIEIRQEAGRNLSSQGGFGLHIVDVLSDRWGVQEGSTRVWFEVSDPDA